MKTFLILTMSLFMMTLNAQISEEIDNVIKASQDAEKLYEEHKDEINSFNKYISEKYETVKLSLNNSMDSYAEEKVVVENNSDQTETITVEQQADNIFKRAQKTVANADNFWNAVESIGIWLKETAENIYKVYRLQYMLIGITALIKILFFVSLIVILITYWFREYKNNKNNGDYFTKDVGLLRSIFVIGSIVLTFVILNSINIAEVFPLFNPDYYIIQDLLSAWK